MVYHSLRVLLKTSVIVGSERYLELNNPSPSQKSLLFSFLNIELFEFFHRYFGILFFRPPITSVVRIFGRFQLEFSFFLVGLGFNYTHVFLIEIGVSLDKILGFVTKKKSWRPRSPSLNFP